MEPQVLASIGAALAVGGASIFAAVVGWLHASRRDLNPRDKGISHYAVGRTHMVMTVAFVVLAIGLVGVVIATVERIQINSAGVIAVVSAALGLLIVAVVPVPGAHAARWRGPVHTAGALVFLVASALGASLVSTQVGPVAANVARTVVGAVGLFLLGMAGVPGLWFIRGWLQRGCFAAIVGWLLVVGWQFAS